MFRFRTNSTIYTDNLYDIDTLEDVALGRLNDEDEAKRVANIAGNMKFYDIFISSIWGLWCLPEEEVE